MVGFIALGVFGSGGDAGRVGSGTLYGQSVAGIDVGLLEGKDVLFQEVTDGLGIIEVGGV